MGTLTPWVILSHQYLCRMVSDCKFVTHMRCLFCITDNYTIYPLPGNMVLVNTFEEIFGDTCGEGVWSELSETVSSNIQDNVVALASFSGDFTEHCLPVHIYIWAALSSYPNYDMQEKLGFRMYGVFH